MLKKENSVSLRAKNKSNGTVLFLKYFELSHTRLAYTYILSPRILKHSLQSMSATNRRRKKTPRANKKLAIKFNHRNDIKLKPAQFALFPGNRHFHSPAVVKNLAFSFRAPTIIIIIVTRGPRCSFVVLPCTSEIGVTTTTTGSPV